MTDKQKIRVIEMRHRNIGYLRISQELQLSVNTVKTFCHRNGLGGRASDNCKYFCRQCGIAVSQNPGRKEKKFCSDTCRMLWWNSHQETVNRCAYYEFTCIYCGKAFQSYGNSHRKYCSRSCANTARRKSPSANECGVL